MIKWRKTERPWGPAWHSGRWTLERCQVVGECGDRSIDPPGAGPVYQWWLCYDGAPVQGWAGTDTGLERIAAARYAELYDPLLDSYAADVRAAKEAAGVCLCEPEEHNGSH